MQAMQLKDEQLRRQLAPQFVQKDANGKVNGFDNEGLYNAMLQGGADPMSINAMRMKQVEMQKALLGLSSAQRDNLDKMHSDFQDALETVQHVNDKESKSTPATPPAPAAQAAPQGSPLALASSANPAAPAPNLTGMANNPSQAALQPIGKAPAGTPESLGKPPDGTAPTPTEAALQTSAANAPRPIGPLTQQVYQQKLMELAQKYGPQAIAQLQPMLHDGRDIEQAEAGIGSLKEAQANAKELAATQQESAKATLDTAQAKAAGWKEIPGMGAFYNPETNELRTPAGQSMSPAMLESKYVMNQERKNAGQPLNAEDQAFDKGFEHFKTMVPAFNFNLQQAGVTSPSFAPGTSAEQMYANFGPKAGIVRGIVEGRQSLPSGFALKTPYWQDIMQKVYQVDPQWNEQTAQLRKNYTVPQGNNAATQINSINTAMGHVGVLGDAIGALNNGDIKFLNKVANNLGVQVGQTPQTTFNTIVHRVGPELTRAYVGSAAGEGERQLTEKDFDPSLSPQQLKSNVEMTAQLLRSKISSLQNQWDQNAPPGGKKFQDQFIMPAAKAALDKYSPQGGGEGTTTRIKASDGSLHDIPSANLAAAKKIDPGLVVQQ